MLFGTQAPKFIHDLGGPNQKIIEFDYVVITKDASDKRMLESESELDGHITRKLLGKHRIFEFRQHLFKYVKYFDLQTAIDKYNEIKSLEGLDGVLYRFRDGKPFKDKSNQNVLFTITNIEETYFDTPDFKDLLLITFESNDYVDMSKSIISPVYITDDLGIHAADDTGIILSP